MGLPFARGGWCEGIRGGVNSSVSRGRPSGYALRVRSPRKALASAPLFPIPRSCASRPRGGSDCACGWRSPAVSRLPMRSRGAELQSSRAARGAALLLCSSRVHKDDAFSARSRMRATLHLRQCASAYPRQRGSAAPTCRPVQALRGYVQSHARPPNCSPRTAAARVLLRFFLFFGHETVMSMLGRRNPPPGVGILYRLG